MEIGLVETATTENPIVGDMELDSTGNPVWLRSTGTPEEKRRLIAQNVKCKFTTWRGEWTQDQTLGIEYQKGAKRPDLIRQDLGKLALSVAGVRRVLSLTYTLDKVNRGMSIECKLLTDVGVINAGLA